MKIGIVGAGKLGLPVALAINSKGHEVVIYDKNPDVAQYLLDKKVPFQEKKIQPLLNANTVSVAPSISSLVKNSDIIFIAVQTPHEPQFEGSTRIPQERADFDYSYIRQAVAEVAVEAKTQRKEVMMVVISTCLPGTFDREIEPLLNKYVSYIYNPFFIAMGTVIDDFLNPEFVLLGSNNNFPAIRTIEKFYSTIHRRRMFLTDITTAEGIKVFYNTFITMKTVLANTYGEMAHKVGMNVDHIYAALSLANDRIISPKYLRAGMGDGGGCHPRDNIALSHLAEKIGMSHNIFEDLMTAREDHADWLAFKVGDLARLTGLPVFILGRSFKPETNIETGSAAILVANLLDEQGIDFVHEESLVPKEVGIYFIGTEHKRYNQYGFPKGSTVIDPFRYIEDQEGVAIIRIGGVNKP